jgi:hypothetical protein
MPLIYSPLLRREIELGKECVRKQHAAQPEKRGFMGLRATAEDTRDLQTVIQRLDYEFSEVLNFSMDIPLSFTEIERAIDQVLAWLSAAALKHDEYEPTAELNRALAKAAEAERLKESFDEKKFNRQYAVSALVGGLVATFGGPSSLPRRTLLMNQELQDTLAAAVGVKILLYVEAFDALQEKRIDLLPGYMKQMEALERFDLQAQIRKRVAQAEQLPQWERTTIRLFSVDDYPIKNPVAQQKTFLEDLADDLRDLAESKGSLAHLRKTPTTDITARITHVSAVQQLIAANSPKNSESPEDQMEKHVLAVIRQIKSEVDMRQAEAELCKQYPEEYHWFIKRRMRQAAEQLN